MAENEVTASPHEFAHRCNVDGTFDSICLFCFHTVGTTSTEPELQICEDRHECEVGVTKPNGPGVQ